MYGGHIEVFDVWGRLDRYHVKHGDLWGIWEICGKNMEKYLQTESLVGLAHVGASNETLNRKITFLNSDLQ